MKMRREWAMPNADTFDCNPIGDFVQRYLAKSTVSVDPFARNKRLATHTNDLNPATEAEHHMDAEDFVRMLHVRGVTADLVIFDPPYSNEQISRSYRAAGFTPTMETTQNGAMYARVRDAISEIVEPGGWVLSFGWNSGGMGKKRGFSLHEVLLVCHGGAHNDTICVAERCERKQAALFP